MEKLSTNLETAVKNSLFPPSILVLGSSDNSIRPDLSSSFPRLAEASNSKVCLEGEPRFSRISEGDEFSSSRYRSGDDSSSLFEAETETETTVGEEQEDSRM